MEFQDDKINKQYIGELNMFKSIKRYATMFFVGIVVFLFGAGEGLIGLFGYLKETIVDMGVESE